MKFTIQNPKPRNPLVAASLRRHAGAHQRCRGAERQQFKRELLRELPHPRPPCC